MRRIIVFVLLISLLLVSCQTDVVKDPLTEYLDASSGFTPEDIPNKLIRQLTSEQVNLLGELHQLKELNSFYQQMIPKLHQEGVRMIALEIPVSASLFIDLYVRGEIPPEMYQVEDHELIDHVLIEWVRTFNEELRESGRADEQIRLVTFDVDWAWTRSYTHLIKYLKKVGLTSAFYQYYDRNIELIDEGTSTGLLPEWEAEFYWISQRMKVNFDNFKLNSPLDLLTPGKWTPELADFRESFMTDNLLHHINQLSNDETILVITGASHVAKQSIVSGDVVSDLPLSARLESSVPGYVNTAIVIVQRLALPELNGVQNEIEMSYLVGEKDLFLELSQVHGDKWAWLDLSAMPPGDYIGESRNNSDPSQTTMLDLSQASDAVIFIPRAEFDLNEFVLPNLFGQ